MEGGREGRKERTRLGERKRYRCWERGVREREVVEKGGKEREIDMERECVHLGGDIERERRRDNGR